MVPIGYMAKFMCVRPDWLKAPHVVDIYSVSNCVNDDFVSRSHPGDGVSYRDFWKHNGYWFFDSPEIIRTVTQENSISLEGTKLFYYEAYEMESDDGIWRPFFPEPSIPVAIVPPIRKLLDGFDVVTFLAGNSPECSPLSCNSMAEEIKTNGHCLFQNFEDAESAIDSGKFIDCEPGPYRIFAVYSVDWP